MLAALEEDPSEEEEMTRDSTPDLRSDTGPAVADFDEVALDVLTPPRAGVLVPEAGFEGGAEEAA